MLNGQICVIIITKIIWHYCFIYSLWYECTMTALITSWSQKGGGAITATWPCWHGCHFITIWYNYLIFEGLLQKIIDVNVYNTCVFVFHKKYKLWAQSHYILNSPRIRVHFKKVYTNRKTIKSFDILCCFVYIRDALSKYIIITYFANLFKT